MPFGNLAGLYALFMVVPFILIYLIRPKSFEKVIPSLMFIMQERDKFRKASFLQKLLRNLLFFLQLLIILILGLSVAMPYLEIPHKVLVRNNVLVLDVSASMATKEGLGTRFSKGVLAAKDNLGMRNTVILAESVPVIVLEDASSGETLGLLDSLKPKATTTNLGDAVLLAGDLLGDKKGVVTVVSDFISTEGSDLLMAKRALASKGNSVNFIDVGGEANNIGITDMIVDKDETVVEIKNFEDKDETVGVSLNKGGLRLSQKEIKLLAGSKEKLTFETPSGVATINLDVSDDLDVDNTAYISSPLGKELMVLLITNYPEGNKIRAAMNALGVQLEIREPPTVNAYNVDHDIVIIDDITKSLFVPTDFTDLKKYVQKGGVVILGAQDDLGDINTQGLLPVDIETLEEKTVSVCVDITGRIFPADPYAEQPCFTTASKYLKARAINGTTTLASAEDGSPMIVHMAQQSGQVLYYGIIDKYSSFYSDPFYPIFWNNMINYLMKTEDIMDFNFKSGKLVALNEQEVKTPTGTVTTNKLLLDEAGVYEFDGKQVAVNLASELESDVSKKNLELESELQKFSEEKVKDVDNLQLEIPLLFAGILFLIIEFFYIKRRGDL
jgi:hypothetical protein